MKRETKALEKKVKVPKAGSRKKLALIGLGAAASVILTWLWIAAE